MFDSLYPGGYHFCSHFPYAERRVLKNLINLYRYRVLIQSLVVRELKARYRGSVLGFLWYNWHPARVFMGDTGSLAVGGTIGLVAVMTGSELLLPLIAFVFLLEFGSSVLQVLWFKASGGRRILPIAPVHLIFQKKDWPERRIVASFLLLGLLTSLSALFFL